MQARILLVEDEINMARTLARNLERAGYEVEHAPHGEAALARLDQTRFDVVLTDLKMPVMDGMTLLHAMHERKVQTCTIVLTGFGTIESAVEAMKLGAADYLIKDARPQEILLTVERVLEFDALKRENVRLKAELKKSHGFGEIVGAVRALGLPLERPLPQAWKRVVLAGTDRGKAAAIAYARRRFPAAELLPTPRSRRPSDGIADALCLAEFGRRLVAGGAVKA